MKKNLMSLIAIICLYAFPTQANAGWFYPGCMAICGAGCIGAEIVFPPVAPGVPSCMAVCANLCALSCFAPGTSIIVLEDGKEVEKEIEEVVIGDLARTIQYGELIWTKVIKNTKISGKFEFIEISVRDAADESISKLMVTPSHGMVLLGVNNDLFLDMAEHAVIGDQMIKADVGSLTIVDVKREVMNSKHILETSDGTVSASGIFVSTICGEEVADGRQLFESKMQDWQERHKDLAKGIFN